MASYDWRLGLEQLEVRDGYFSSLKSYIEFAFQRYKKRVVVLAHSLGSIVFYYFMKWAESPIGGKGGDMWVSTHIESFVNVAGPMLGVPKAFASLFAGDMHNNAQLGSLGRLLDRLIPRQNRTQLFRSWLSLGSMLLRGGDPVWGSVDRYTDPSHSHLVSFLPGKNAGLQNLTVDEAQALLFRIAGQNFEDNVNKLYSFGIKTEHFIDQPKYWSNVLESQLPDSPSTNIYCLYGVGKPAERAYYMKESNAREDQEIGRPFGSSLMVNAEEQQQQQQQPSFQIDYDVHDSSEGVDYGVRLVDGDGTVPLLSLGLVCAKTWKDVRWNPSNMSVTSREYLHQDNSLVTRSSSSADHVDILGNRDLIRDMLLVCGGQGNRVEPRVSSNIAEMSNLIDL
mmetsp:Transcript_54955/g.91339  ORF Transcript_54955/g.91339 Transcript_54955/m.91339 type:complete len:394 (-) Transcript_54955:298-1479(-)